LRAGRLSGPPFWIIFSSPLAFDRFSVHVNSLRSLTAILRSLRFLL
jgi:hypothetical protein